MDNLRSLNPQKLFAGIGIAYAASFAVRFSYFIWLYFLRPSGLSKYARPNAYAMVTGASDGIGKALARELAGQGFNIVLHGRNATKLEAVKAEIQRSHPARKVVVEMADAGNSHGMKKAIEAIVADLGARLDGPLTVLVNNCGGCSPQADEFAQLLDLTAAEIDAMINLNARFHVQLTRALLPLMEGRGNAAPGQKDRRGAEALVMYTGSIAGVVPGPWLTLYAPAKQFGNAWIASLGREMMETRPNIEAVGIIIGAVTDVSFLHDKPTPFMPDSGTVAKAMLHKVGCGKLNVVGHWGHAVQASVVALLPESLQTRAINGAMKTTIEKARLRKLEE